MNAQQLNLEVIANNLANVNTEGFKSSRANFEDLFYIERQQPGVENANGDQRPTGLYVGLGVEIDQVHRFVRAQQGLEIDVVAVSRTQDTERFLAPRCRRAREHCGQAVAMATKRVEVRQRATIGDDLGITQGACRSARRGLRWARVVQPGSHRPSMGDTPFL